MTPLTMTAEYEASRRANRSCITDDLFDEIDALRAALDEARRERDEAREAAGSDKLHLFGELKNARAREASERTWRERAESQRDEARQEMCSLLSGHLSPSDAARLAAITRATAARRGWGM